MHSSIKVVISRLSKLANTHPEVRNRLVKIEYLASTANKLLHCKMKHIQPIRSCWAGDSNPGFSACRAGDFQIKLLKLSANIFSQIFTCRCLHFTMLNIGHRIWIGLIISYIIYLYLFVLFFIVVILFICITFIIIYILNSVPSLIQAILNTINARWRWVCKGQ